MLSSKHNSKHRKGFTLVELLVVLVIATVILSLAIPRIRTVNKERNLREAARVVGSAFANASQRAVSDGVAGVRIIRNPNFVIGTRQYAASEISLLRKVPNFSGDAVGATITNTLPTGSPDNQISIILPLEQAALQIIQPGDEISFGTSPARYTILEANSGLLEDGAANTGLVQTMQIIVDQLGYLPTPRDGSTYVIHRRPRVLRSSISFLPEGYLVDLRYSGFVLLDGYDPGNPLAPGGLGCYDVAGGVVRPQQLTTVFEPAPTDFAPAPTGAPAIPANLVENYIIDFLFDESGAIDRIIYTENGDEDLDGFPFETVFRRPLGPIYFMMAEAPNTIDTNKPLGTAEDSVLWVSVATSGSTNIGYNNSAESQSSGLTENLFGAFYFAEDPDGDINNIVEEDDRDEFNAMMERARDNSLSASAGQ